MQSAMEVVQTKYELIIELWDNLYRDCQFSFKSHYLCAIERFI